MATHATSSMGRYYVAGLVRSTFAAGMAFFLMACVGVGFCRAQTVTVSVNTGTQVGTSEFLPGSVVADSLDPWDDATDNSAAITSGEGILTSSTGYLTQEMMGWGQGDIEPSKGDYSWTQLTEAVDEMNSIGGTPVITLCSCPGWMKSDSITSDGGSGDIYTWNLNLAPLPDHYQDFANLCLACVEQYYPMGVHYYQVWNELKGFFDSDTNNWNYVDYTTLYNDVYTTIKAKYPTGVYIGGPYLPVEGDGQNLSEYYWGMDPITSRNVTTLDYWLANADGADFLTVDRDMIDYQDPNTYSVAVGMSTAPFLGSILTQLNTLMADNTSGPLAGRQLPIWLPELYSYSQGDTAPYPITSASMATCLQQCVLYGATVAFEWQPEDDTLGSTWPYSLFTNCANVGGGAAYPQAGVLQDFKTYFPPGTALYQTTSSSASVSVLASVTNAMLVNTTGSTVTADVNGTDYNLSAYQTLMVTLRSAAPTGLSAIAGNARVSLAWNASTGANSYNIYRSQTSGTGYAKIGSCTTLTYTDSSVTNGTTYYYVVTAVNGTDESGYSNQATAKPTAPAAPSIPAAPTGLSAVAGNDRVRLTWNVSAGATSYNVYRSPTSGKGYAKIGSSTTTTYTDSSVTNGKTYYYVVTAVNGQGASGYSNQASAMPTAPTPVRIPAAPTGLSAVAGNARVTLTWSASARGTSYNVYRSTTRGSGYAKIGPSATLTYTDSSVTNGKEYYYVVTAVDSAGASGYSNVASATPTAPAAPVIASFPSGVNFISLPYDYSSVSLASVLGYGDPILAVWSPTASSYILSPNSPADRIRLGVGYWVRFPKAVSVTLRGTPASTTGVAIDLSPGWNQIGDPYPSSVALSGVDVASGFNDDSYADAVSAGLIGAALYRYDTGTNAYETVGASGNLEPGSGYFIDATASVTLQVNAP